MSSCIVFQVRCVIGVLVLVSHHCIITLPIFFYSAPGSVLASERYHCLAAILTNPNLIWSHFTIHAPPRARLVAGIPYTNPRTFNHDTFRFHSADTSAASILTCTHITPSRCIWCVQEGSTLHSPNPCCGYFHVLACLSTDPEATRQYLPDHR